MNRLWHFTAAALWASAVFAEAGEKKVVFHGWSTPSSEEVARHWKALEAMPIDGVGINIALKRDKPTSGDGSTTNLLGWQLFGATAFDLRDFQQAISDLQVPEWTKFTENFLHLAIATRDQDQGLSWFDNRRWATIENNWRVFLMIARQGGCRGVLLDPEHYDYECELFNFRHHRRQRVDRSFAEYHIQAHARGRQLGAVAAEIFPEIVVGLFYGYTLPWEELRRGELEAGRYALLPAFLDGLLEASAAGAQFVDLWEFGHKATTRAEFLAGREAITKGAASLASNPELYRTKLSPGMSVRADPRIPDSALKAAREASDRYVWIYSEQTRGLFPGQ